MSLASEIFNMQQKQFQPNINLTPQQMAYNNLIGTKVYDTINTNPQQKAYDNWLEQQNKIKEENNKYRTFNGLMQGAGGLGKILASAFVKDPMQQAGAMQGLGEQETRTDQLRQAYENARNAQNKDYVAQAKEQLDQAILDEEKAYNRDLTASQIAYKKIQDEIDQQNKEREFEANNERWNKEFGLKEKVSNAQVNKLKTEIAALQNKPEKSEEDIIKLQKAQVDLQIAQENLNKAKRENDPEYIQQQNEQKQKEELNKQRQEQLKKNQERAFNLINSNSVTPALGNLMLNNPELMPYLKDSGEFSKPKKYFGLTFGSGNDNKFEFNYEQYLIDNGKPVTKANIKQLKKDLGL